MTTSLSPLYQFLIVAGACWLLIFPVCRLLLYFGVIDRPNERSSHTVPVIRGGGIVIVLIIVIWLALAGSDQVGLVLPLLGLAITSFWDDCRSLGVRLRFGVQALAAASALAWVWPQAGILEFSPTAVFLPVAFIWIAGYTNAFNFMDGINGLAGGQAAITALGSALIGHSAGLPWIHPAIALSVVIAGTTAGFLPHNFPRARVFMGDAGSASLGFLLSVLTIWIARDAGWWLLVPLSLLHANFVLDTGITLLRRIVRKEKWHEAHREHFYQRLVRAGKKHHFVTSVEMLIQSLVLVLMLAFQYASPALRAGLVTGVVALWLVFFAYAEKLFLRTRP